MKGVYIVLFEAVAVTAAQDLFECLAADDRPLELLEVGVYQTTEVATNIAEEEFLTVRVRRNLSTGTSGSGGSTFTPLPTERNGGTAGFACEINNTTQNSGGTLGTMSTKGWNIRQEHEKIWVPETKIQVGGNEFLLVTITAPADSTTMSGYAYIQELS